MNIRNKGLFIAVFLTLAVVLFIGAGNARASVINQYDGGVQKTDGTWDLPDVGFCASDPTQLTRPDCLAQRYPTFVTQATCAVGAVPSRAWATSGVCDDPTYDGNSAGCLGAAGTRVYSNGKCTLTMKGESRNVATCNNLGGTWVTSGKCVGTWMMPDASTYNPVVPNGSMSTYPKNPSTGGSCMRCHNEKNQWNGTDIRWVGESFLEMGHKNMARKVVQTCDKPGYCSILPLVNTTASTCQIAAGVWTRATDLASCTAASGTWAFMPWAGPNDAVYPKDDSGNILFFGPSAATIDFTPTTGIGTKDLRWVFGDWLAPLPRTIHATDPVAGKPGVSYSCARCHTTGWTADSTLQATKQPEATWPGITWDGVAVPVTGQVNLASGVSGDSAKLMASWDQFGIQCSRCHGSAYDTSTGVCEVTTTYGTKAACETKPTPNGTWNVDTNKCYITSASTSGLCTIAPGGAGVFTAGPPFSGPINAIGRAIMATHTNNLTVADNNSGVCTDSRFLTETECLAANPVGPRTPQGVWQTNCSINPTAGVCTTSDTDSVACGTSGGTWITAGVTAWCRDNTSYTTFADCVTNNGFKWQDGFCKRAELTWDACYTAGFTWSVNGTPASCQLGGGVWSGYGSCTIPSICSKPGYATNATCTAASGKWTSLTSEYTCISAGGHYTGNHKTRGQLITSLCMECHRQETSGLPYANATAVAGTFTTVNPGTYLKVGPAHNTIAPVSHPHGNMVLNSPHGMFSGTFAEIATKKKGDANGFTSNFMDQGEALATGNGCTGCHNVHKSTVSEANPSGEATFECEECHTNVAKAADTPQIDISKVNHLGGAGTPLENVALDPSESCELCHMPEGLHLWRINTDASYSTFPAAALAGTTNANTAPYTSVKGNTFANAVWVDVDAACGSCHGGGNTQQSNTGTIKKYLTSAACTAAPGGIWGTSCNLNKILTVASTTGFTAGSKIRIAGAGALLEDGVTRDDWDTYILSVNSPTQMTLVGDVIGCYAPAGCAGVAVEQNATTNSAPYRTKANLAVVAKGIHSSSGVSYPVTFVYTKSGLTVNATAQVDCGGACPAFTYDWSWGDGLSDLAVVTATKSHTYLTAGKKTITLTVNLGGLSVGTATRSLTVTAPDNPPVANANCTVLPAGWNANTWTMTIIDTSTDTDSTPVQTIAVDWGDGSSKSFGAQGGTFAHTYNSAGTYTVTDKAIDTALKYSVFTCVPSPTAVNFTISGTVKNNAGTVNLASALVVLLKNGNPVKTAYTAANGTFSFTALKPATYTLKVTKSGYTFTNPAATKTVGPDQTAFVINALP